MPEPLSTAGKPQDSKPSTEIAKRTIGTEGFSLLPRSFDELKEFVRMIASSELVPKAYQNKPENVMVAIQMGTDVGLKPLQAIQSIAVINGFPSLWGDGALALVMSSGALEEMEERSPEEALQEGGGLCTVKRKGMSAIDRSFTVDQAKKAGLWEKAGPWQTYPGRMLQMRARALALRDRFADILRGLYIAEEAQDIPIETIPPTITKEEITPRRKSETKKMKAETIDIKIETVSPSTETIPEKIETVPPEVDPDFDKEDDGTAATETDIEDLLDAMKIKKIKADKILPEMKKRFSVDRLSDLTQYQAKELSEWVRIS